MGLQSQSSDGIDDLEDGDDDDDVLFVATVSS